MSSFTKLPTSAEDKERAKLKGLAGTFNWTHKDGDPEFIEGSYEGKDLVVGVDRKLFEIDVLFYKTKSKTQLKGSIVHENFITKGGKALASFLQKFFPNIY